MQPSQSHAFDFVYGHWNVRNRKLRNVADPECEEWLEFDATSDVFPILDGIGHVDRMFVPQPTDGESFEGFTLRLFEPATETWSIWWSSTRAPGHLDPPVVGHFVNGVGTFECDDVVGGHDVKVRFQWHAHADTPVWRQFFSYDDGVTWKKNWEMMFSRKD